MSAADRQDVADAYVAHRSLVTGHGKRAALEAELDALYADERLSVIERIQAALRRRRMNEAADLVEQMAPAIVDGGDVICICGAELDSADCIANAHIPSSRPIKQRDVHYQLRSAA